MKNIWLLMLFTVLASSLLVSCRSERENIVSEHGIYHAQADAFRDGSCVRCETGSTVVVKNR